MIYNSQRPLSRLSAQTPIHFPLMVQRERETTFFHSPLLPQVRRRWCGGKLEIDGACGCRARAVISRSFFLSFVGVSFCFALLSIRVVLLLLLPLLSSTGSREGILFFNNAAVPMLFCMERERELFFVLTFLFLAIPMLQASLQARVHASKEE